jgi:aspartate racemase
MPWSFEIYFHNLRGESTKGKLAGRGWGPMYRMKEMIGIVGGMGSHATVSFFQQLINHSHAKKDQEYMEILIHNNTHIPDRTAGILYHGDDPLPELLRSVKTLECGGAGIIILACITAHYYYEQLEESLTTAKIFHIVKETVDYTCSYHPHIKNVGVLATEGSIKTQLWQKDFAKRQINTLVLPDQLQIKYFNNVVYGHKGIKAGYRDDELKNTLLAGCKELINMGAEAIIGACSELPLMISKEDLPVPYIDSIHVTIEKLINLHYGNTV